jgi:hypothetical protein
VSKRGKRQRSSLGEEGIVMYGVWSKNSSSLALSKKLKFFNADELIGGTSNNCCFSSRFSAIKAFMPPTLNTLGITHKR